MTDLNPPMEIIELGLDGSGVLSSSILSDQAQGSNLAISVSMAPRNRKK